MYHQNQTTLKKTGIIKFRMQINTNITTEDTEVIITLYRTQVVYPKQIQVMKNIT